MPIDWVGWLCFGGAPHIFQIICFTNMSGKGELWTTTTTLLMWPWPMRMVNRVKLTRWSWLDRSSFIDYLTVIITYHQQLARGCRSSDAQLPHFPPIQIFFQEPGTSPCLCNVVFSCVYHMCLILEMWNCICPNKIIFFRQLASSKQFPKESNSVSTRGRR